MRHRRVSGRGLVSVLAVALKGCVQVSVLDPPIVMLPHVVRMLCG